MKFLLWRRRIANIALILMLGGVVLQSSSVYASTKENYFLRVPLFFNTPTVRFNIWSLRDEEQDKILLTRLIQAWSLEKGLDITRAELDSDSLTLYNKNEYVALVCYSREWWIDGWTIGLTITKQRTSDLYRERGLMTILQTYLFYVTEANEVIYRNCVDDGPIFLERLKEKGIFTDIKKEHRRNYKESDIRAIVDREKAMQVIDELILRNRDALFIYKDLGDFKEIWLKEKSIEQILEESRRKEVGL